MGILVAFLFSAVIAFRIGAIVFPVFVSLVLGGTSIGLVGFVDDRYSLPAYWRLIVHLVASSLVVFPLLMNASSIFSRFGPPEIWFIAVIISLAITWAVNLFNFMDGIDGLAGSEAVFMAGAGGWLNWANGGDIGLTYLLVSIAAGCLGFLVWNWPPAKIFMGDVGSSFLGFILASLGLMTSNVGILRIEVWLILGGVFLTDASVTLVRRMIRGDHLLEAHRLHAYQRLSRRWKGHRPVTLLSSAVNVFWLLPWAWAASSDPRYASLYAVIALLPLIVAVVLSGAGKVEVDQ